MTTNPPSFCGVFCLRCGEPIAVSPRIVSLQGETEQQESEGPRSFVARCKLCEYESMYEVTKVQRFDGEPRKRTKRMRAA